MKNRAFYKDTKRFPNWIDPHEVTPYDGNAKLHDDKQIGNIVNSITRFGWQQDVVLTRDNVLVIGHGRMQAALCIGCEMPFHYVDRDADELSEEDVRELRDADNLTNAQTGFDFDKLAADFDELDFSGFDWTLEDFGFEDLGDHEFGSDDSYLKEQTEPEAKEGKTCTCPQCGFTFETL